MFLLAIDVGAQSIKLALLDPSTRKLVVMQHAARFMQPRLGWAEADPSSWWETIRRGIPDLLNATGARPGEVAAIALSTMCPALALLDPAGAPLRPAILYLDQSPAGSTR
jgi:sugar (pentulose or hexulose) kinase